MTDNKLCATIVFLVKVTKSREKTVNKIEIKVGRDRWKEPEVIVGYQE